MFHGSSVTRRHIEQSRIGGQPNMYMANYRCHVTGSNSNRKLAPAKAPVYCQNDRSKCVKGAKQMVAWNRKCLFTT